ncbi:hypothetical protein AT269_00780 [Bacillus cereus]|nr:hypothetical protein AT269_00780 [Bacillus cereus]
MEECEHKQLQELKQIGGPILMMCIKCNQIIKVSKGSSTKIKNISYSYEMFFSTVLLHVLQHLINQGI